jgi:signal transduction histidine kinase
MLTSRQPMFVWWGDELVNLYNDAYKTIVGGKHPHASGSPRRRSGERSGTRSAPRRHRHARQRGHLSTKRSCSSWSATAIRRRPTTPSPTARCPTTRAARGGILCANSDHTQQIVSERQLALLRELATSAAEARTVDEACALSAAALAADRHDLPFTLLYTVEQSSGAAVLAGSSGVPTGSQAAPRRIAQGDATWPIADIFDAGVALPLRELDSRLARAPARAVEAAGARRARSAHSVRRPDRRRRRAHRRLEPRPPARRRLPPLPRPGRRADREQSGRARAYAAERQRATELAELDRAKTIFFSNVSHEFRTPLTLLLGPLDDLLHDPANEAQQSLLRTMQRNGQRLLRLVNTLLDFSRIEAGRVEASFEPVDLGALTEELASAFRTRRARRPGARDHAEDSASRSTSTATCGRRSSSTCSPTPSSSRSPAPSPLTLAREGDTAVLRVADTGAGHPAVRGAQAVQSLSPCARHARSHARGHRASGSRWSPSSCGCTAAASRRERARPRQRVLRAHPVRQPSPAERARGEEPSAASGRQEARRAPFVDEAMRWLGGDDAPASENARTTRALAGGPRGRVLLADDNADMREYVRRLLAPTLRGRAVADGVAALDGPRGAARPRSRDVMMPRIDGFELLRRCAPPRNARRAGAAALRRAPARRRASRACRPAPTTT